MAGCTSCPEENTTDGGTHDNQGQQSGTGHARQLIQDARIARDTRDDWSEHAPDAAQENAFIDKHGYTEYGTWYLGVDSEKTHDTKGHYSFPFGDFRRLHRCAVLAIESRAAQYDHDDIAKAAKSLLDELDKD